MKKSETVLAMGDSITEGGKEFTCYRQFLVPKLQEMGVQVKFIGPKSDNISAHAGYGGKNVAFLLDKSKEIYSAYPADIVLLHAGHNNFSQDKPVPGIVHDTEAIIRNFAHINPDVTVLLAQVIPSGKLPKYSYIPELNNELKALAERLTKEGLRVVLVDQADRFDWTTDTIGDMVHPNAEGARKMAEKWLAALGPQLKRDVRVNGKVKSDN
jgi:lysophospholipase L1-like esterase